MITFNNDHKDKSQSFTVRFRDTNNIDLAFREKYPDAKGGVYGYGANIDEAIDNFRLALSFYIDELEAMKKLYIDDATFLDNNIVEVDCMGKPLKNE